MQSLAGQSSPLAGRQQSSTTCLQQLRRPRRGPDQDCDVSNAQCPHPIERPRAFAPRCTLTAACLTRTPAKVADSTGSLPADRRLQHHARPYSRVKFRTPSRTALPDNSSKADGIVPSVSPPLDFGVGPSGENHATAVNPRGGRDWWAVWRRSRSFVCGFIRCLQRRGANTRVPDHRQRHSWQRCICWWRWRVGIRHRLPFRLVGAVGRTLCVHRLADSCSGPPITFRKYWLWISRIFLHAIGRIATLGLPEPGHLQTAGHGHGSAVAHISVCLAHRCSRRPRNPCPQAWQFIQAEAASRLGLIQVFPRLTLCGSASTSSGAPPTERRLRLLY